MCYLLSIDGKCLAIMKNIQIGIAVFKSIVITSAVANTLLQIITKYKNLFIALLKLELLYE